MSGLCEVYGCHTGLRGIRAVMAMEENSGMDLHSDVGRNGRGLGRPTNRMERVDEHTAFRHGLHRRVRLEYIVLAFVADHSAPYTECDTVRTETEWKSLSSWQRKSV